MASKYNDPDEGVLALAARTANDIGVARQRPTGPTLRGREVTKIGLALDVVAFLFLAMVALVTLAGLAVIPPRGWRIIGGIARALVLLVLYFAAPDVLVGLAALGAMVGLAVFICRGFDHLWKRCGGSPGKRKDWRL